MKAFLEITKWDCPAVNHVYFMDDTKTRAYAYAKFAQTELFEFKSPLKIDTRGRKFQEVANTWGFAVREESDAVGKSVQVCGSKGSVYTVTNDHGSWTCTCPASKWQAGDCKHIKSLQPVL